jgi:hypothetical protein
MDAAVLSKRCARLGATIRPTGKGSNVHPNVGDDVLVELLGRAAEQHEGGLNAYGPADFQFRIARVAGANHLAVSFADPELEKARQAAQTTAPSPVNKAALVLQSATQKEIGFPVFHSTGCGGRRMPANSHSWVCESSLRRMDELP